MKENRKAVIALSGGMDSTTLLYWAIKEKYDLTAISFDYGQNHKKEIEFAKWHCEKLNIPHKTIKLDFLNEISNSSLTSGAENIPEGMYDEDNMKSTVVPFRNGIILSVMAAYAEANDCKYLFYGAHQGDHAIYPDCRQDFVENMSKAITLGTYTETKILNPFIDKDKSDVCRIGLELGVPYEKTWSCYKGGKIPCLVCGTCSERTEAFLDNNIEDPSLTKEQWDNAVKYYWDLKRC